MQVAVALLLSLPWVTPAAPVSAALVRVNSANESAYALIHRIPLTGSAYALGVLSDDTIVIPNQQWDELGFLERGQTAIDDTVATGRSPQSLAVAADDSVYIGNYAQVPSDEVSVINGRERTSIGGVEIAGQRAMGLAVNDDTLYVTTYTLGTPAGALYAVRRSSNQVITSRADTNYYTSAVTVVDDTVYTGPSGVAAGTGKALFSSARSLAKTAEVTSSSVAQAARSSASGRVFLAGFDGLRWIVPPSTTIDDSINVGGWVDAVTVSRDDTLVYAYFDTIAIGRSSAPGETTDLTLDPSDDGMVTGLAMNSAGVGYAAVSDLQDALLVFAPVSASMTSATGAAGSVQQIDLAVTDNLPIDDSTVVSVHFGGTLAVGWTRQGTSVTGPVPAGSGTVAVTVNLHGGQAVSAGSFTYSAPPPSPPPALPPGAPREAAAEAGNSQAYVTWLAPTFSGSYPVSHYLVSASPGGASCTAAGDARSCLVAGLVNGTAYTFSVKALNGAGWGPPSLPTDAVTPMNPASPSIVISGARDARQARVIVIDGTAPELVGVQVAPWVRLYGQVSFFQGKGHRTVDDRGEFTWRRKANKQISVYFAGGDVTSNRVTIPARPASRR